MANQATTQAFQALGDAVNALETGNYVKNKEVAHLFDLFVNAHGLQNAEILEKLDTLASMVADLMGADAESPRKPNGRTH